MSDVVLDIRELKGWYGESQALHGVNLTVNKGETVALLGANGAGKTSTLKAVTGMLPRCEGSITLAGQEVLSLAPHKLARLGVGYVPEDRGIFSGLTVRENLCLPPVFGTPVMSDKEIYEVFPNLAERERSDGGTLSGGEQQMLAIARALRSDVRVLMLDEPTEGLSPLIVARIGMALRILRDKGVTILLVEQNFRFVSKLSDRFYVMQHGRIADHFSSQELASREAALEEMLSI